MGISTPGVAQTERVLTLHEGGWGKFVQVGPCWGRGLRAEGEFSVGL